MFKLIYPEFWQKRGALAYLLWPFSILYLLAGYLRWFIAQPVKFPCKVICVGNITVGGTGKTQIVIYIAKLLKARNINFVIVTKGFGSQLKVPTLVQPYHSYEDVGDESIILAKYGTVIAAKNIQSILTLVNKLKPSVILVDDSLQNPNFYKDCTIITVDGSRLFGNEFLLPAGPLRQYPKTAFKKANIVIFIDINDNDNYHYHDIDQILTAQIVPTIKLDVTKNYFAFCGIGNPQRFFATLRNYGIKLAGCKIFPDHHNYSTQDFKYLQEQAIALNAILITTRKDFVKIPADTIPSICCDVELSFNDPTKLENLIDAKIF